MASQARRPMEIGDLYAYGRGKRSHHLFKLVEGGKGETACGMRVAPEVLGGGSLVTAAKYRAEPSCVKCKAVLSDADKGREQLGLFGGKAATDPRPDPPRPATPPRDPVERPRPLIFPPAPVGMLLQEAVDELERDIDKWTTCRCCQQKVALYKRGLDRGKAQCLIGLVRVFQTGVEWVKVKDVPVGRKDARVRGGQLAKLRWWGLIEEQSNQPGPEDESEADAEKRRKKLRSGYWRPTPAGVDFVYGRLRVDKYVLTYNNRRYGSLGPEVGLLDVLGDDFDIRDLKLLDAEIDLRRGRG